MTKEARRSFRGGAEWLLDTSTGLLPEDPSFRNRVHHPHQGVSVAVDIEANISGDDRRCYASKLRRLADHAQRAAGAIEVGNDEEACLRLVLFWLQSDADRKGLVEIFLSVFEQNPGDGP